MGFETFEKFGIITHTKESKAAYFVTCLEQGKVMTTKCKKCVVHYFPPQVDCPKCLGSDMEWVEVTGNGKLITYSIVQYGPIGFEDRTPYVVALAEFSDGIKVFAGLSRKIQESNIIIGMGVKVVSKKLPDNKIYYEFDAIEG